MAELRFIGFDEASSEEPRSLEPTAAPYLPQGGLLVHHLMRRLRAGFAPASRRLRAGFAANFLASTSIASLGMAQTSIFVDVQSTATTPGGTGWTDALPTLQQGLTVAASTGGQVRILVADGTYRPEVDASGNSAVPQEQWIFSLPDNVNLHGGFLGFHPDSTVLATRSSDWNDPDGSFQNTVLSGAHLTGNPSYHVVTTNAMLSDAVIDGFVITGGRANGGGLESRGGGLVNAQNDATLTIENVWFLSNSADDRGGAIFTASAMPTRLRFCTFARNYAEEGGGIYHGLGLLEMANCLFALNGSIDGGATYPATEAGGALWIDDQTNSWFQNCVFHDNEAIQSGGAIHHRAFTGVLGPLLTNSFEHFYHNCTLTQNRLDVEEDSQQGAGIHVTAGKPRATSPDLAQQNIRIINTIVWGNAPGVDVAVFGDPNHGSPPGSNPLDGVDVDVSYSDIGTSASVNTTAPGGLDLTLNNLSIDPQFMNLALRNLRLRGPNASGFPVSPCIDFGLSGIPGVGDDRLNIDDDPTAPFEELPWDMDLEERDYDIMNLGVRSVDLGAYERQG